MTNSDPIVRSATEADLEYMTGIGTSERKNVGFLPKQAYADYVLSKHAAVVVANDDPVGFMLFGSHGKHHLVRTPGTVPIMLCVVQPDARRILHGTSLVEYLLNHPATTHAATIALWCREDLPANKFWQELGFTPNGRRLRHRIRKPSIMHNRWIMPIAAPIAAQLELPFTMTTEDCSKTE